ncbi:hypothetical protein SMD44_06997 [Streptomyces alboflavus]|uniref:FAD-dependent oxidoreductase n=1 Tax=Streptomyces alboflavus TaxID=67267 RepID=A0A1Z1WM46_9ACTN|nr:hypothetical protein SMD44_06997 [Streptomyces alboflavus]
MPSMLDAVVVGAGPNGLTAAVELARRGFSVAVFEARGSVGGGARTEELTLPGFRHDPCSAAHPLGINSPAFRAMPLERYGLAWLQPELPMAHPLLDGRAAAVLARSVAETAASFGPRDAGAYRRLVEPFLPHWDTLLRDFMSLPLTALPRDPVLLARFGLVGLPPSTWLMRRFRDDPARALFSGLVAHVIAPLGGLATGGVGMVFALAAHARGWPLARGGSQSISDALAAYLTDLGGIIHTTTRSSGSTTCRPPARTSSTPRPPRSPGSPDSGAITTTSGTAPPPSRSTTRSTGPCRGPRPRRAPRAPSRSVRAAARSVPRCGPRPARAGRRTRRS